MVEDILFRCGNVRSIEKSLSSVSLRLTALPDKASPERGGARRRRAEGFVPLRREGRGGSVSRRDHNSVYRRPHPTHRRDQLRRKVASQTPAALREWGSGGEALLSEKRPLPQRPPILSLRKGVRGRTLLYREAFSPANLTFSFLSFFRWRFGGRHGRGSRLGRPRPFWGADP